jgi:dolichol-phosphate mannosyltransferase
MKVVVVTATYNEKENIGKFITVVEEEVFPKIKHYNMCLLVADDNSPDGTGDIVKDFMKKYPNLNISTGSKKGLGAAYMRAMSYAIQHMDADILISIDADFQHDPHSIPEFLKKIEQGYDIVCGTRYSHGGSIPKNWPLYRKAFSRVGNFTVRTITGRFHLHDWTTSFRAIKKDVFLQEKEKIQQFQGYTFIVAFLYKAILDGYKAGEVPIHFRNRNSGDSKIAPLEYIINLLKYVIYERLGELQPFRDRIGQSLEKLLARREQC